MKSFFFALAVSLLAPSLPVSAQQTGDAWRDYLVNGVGSGQPSLVSTTIDLVTAPLFVNRYVTQDPGAPVIWWISSSASPGQFQIGPNFIDIGNASTGFSDLNPLGDGLEPGFWNSLFVTSSTGFLEIGLSVAPAAAGLSANFAMMHFAATSPVGFWFSQAHQVQFQFPDIVVQAVGPNSLNANTNRGFWRVMHQGTLAAITDVTFDFAGASDPVVATTEFDVDQPGLAARFVFGNGAAPASGTYRNASDVAVGLVYDSQNSFDMVSFGGLTGGNCGFMASNPVGSPFDFHTLRFRFLAGAFSGNLFEFDCDTDAGAGFSGAAMAGCVISIGLQDGTQFQGALAPVAGATMSTSQVSF